MITFVAVLDAEIPPAVLAAIYEAPGPFFFARDDNVLSVGRRNTMLRDVQTTASTQIFASGRVQIAGCSSHIEFAAIMEELLDLLARHISSPMHIVEFEPKLINLNLGLGVRIHLGDNLLDAMMAELRPLNDRRRVEKRENYAPLTIILPSARPSKSITCQLFATGNFQVSGWLPGDLATAMRTVLQFLEARPEFVLEPTPKDVASDRTKTSACWFELVRQFPGLAHTHVPVPIIVPGCLYCSLFGNVFSI